jgi:hypothetical protein
MHRSSVLPSLFATTGNNCQLYAPFFISSRGAFISLPYRRSTAVVVPGRQVCR